MALPDQDGSRELHPVLTVKHHHLPVVLLLQRLFSVLITAGRNEAEAEELNKGQPEDSCRNSAHPRLHTFGKRTPKSGSGKDGRGRFVQFLWLQAAQIVPVPSSRSNHCSRVWEYVDVVYSCKSKTVSNGYNKAL